MAVTGPKRLCPLPLHFFVALTVAAVLYGQRILSTWARQAESELVVLCLVSERPDADPARLIADLQRDQFLHTGRVVEPGEVAAWVADVIGEDRAATTPTTPVATTGKLPAAVELIVRDAVREPDRFAHAIGAARRHPASSRLFYDAAAQERAANVYGRLRALLRACFFLVLAGSFAAVAGSGRARAASSSPGAPASTPFSSRPVGVIRGALKRWAGSVAGLLGPAAAGWFCLFAVLALWPMPPPDGLSAASHATVFALTFLASGLVVWCAAAVGRYFV